MDFQDKFIKRLKEEGIPLGSVSRKQLERINEILKEMTDDYLSERKVSPLEQEGINKMMLLKNI